MFDLNTYGYTQAGGDISAGLVPGRVTEDRRDLYKVICEYGEVPAVLNGSFYHTIKEREDLPAVGDFVTLKYNMSGNSSITGVLPRRSKFFRTDFSGHSAGYAKHIQEQVVAANFDYVFILSSLNYDFREPLKTLDKDKI